MEEQDPTEIALLKERVGRLERRVDTHGEEIDALRIQAEHDSVVLARIDATVTKTQVDIEEIKQTPGRRWESAVLAAIGVLVGWALTQMGLV